MVFKKKDKRIKVIHKQNGGLSSARNVGLEIAQGKYVTFFDSDDYADKTMYEKLKNSIDKYNSDIASCTIYKKYKLFKKPANKTKEEHVYSEKEKFVNAKNGNGCITVGACNKLYKREIFKEIRYPEGKIYEDSYVIYDVLSAADKVSFVPEPLYFYRIRKSGIIRGKSKKYFNQIEAMDKNIKFFEEKDYKDLIEKEKYRKAHAILNIAYKYKFIHYLINL